MREDEIPKTAEGMGSLFCQYCSNDWYCPFNSPCKIVAEVRKAPYEKLRKAYIETDGMMYQMANRVKGWIDATQKLTEEVIAERNRLKE